jgi:hypothetical protein
MRAAIIVSSICPPPWIFVVLGSEPQRVACDCSKLKQKLDYLSCDIIAIVPTANNLKHPCRSSQVTGHERFGVAHHSSVFELVPPFIIMSYQETEST